MIVSVKSTPVVYLGRKVLKVVEFENEGTFQAFWAAEGYLREKGYSSGSTDRSPNPVGFIHAPEWPLPQKWHNITSAGKKLVDGVMIGSFRYGPVKLIFFNIKHDTTLEISE